MTKKTDNIDDKENSVDSERKVLGSSESRHAPKPYLEKDFGTELNFKLWVTKGARFVASKRLMARHKWSIYSVGVLSVYVIILGMADGFNISIGLSGNLSTFATTAMTVVILIFSQLELSKEYSLKAREFHQCGLEIGELYNEWRWVKTNDTSKDKTKKIRDLSKRYSAVLRRYENHEEIDRRVFQLIYSDYFEIGFWARRGIRLQYYMMTFLTYHLAMTLPPVVYLIHLYFL